MGAAAAPEADGPGGPAGSENGQGLLRVRREREAETLDPLEAEATTKAAIWGAIAGVAHLAATAIGPGFYPDWYFLLTAVAYGLLLPVIAVLHVRHRASRQSGAVLGTIAGTAVVTLGIAASASPPIVVAALFVRGIWWWTIGKLWWETDLFPRWLGLATMALAVLCIALALSSGAMGVDMSVAWIPLRLALGAWLLVLSVILWRSR